MTARVGILLFAVLCCNAVPIRAQHLLIPMDDEQRNHLKAYGVTFAALQDGSRSEWLLNYRGGSFLLVDSDAARRRAALAGVSAEPLDESSLQAIRAEIATSNMDAVVLERAPRIAIYTPPTSQPWDDAVTLALEYAGIPYTTVWDDDVLAGALTRFDWLHLHHEDFTGQLNKFHLSFAAAPWFQRLRNETVATAERLGFADPPALKKAVAEMMRRYVEQGGLLFAMCGATETLELAIAGQRVDIADASADGTPRDADADARLDWTRSFAFDGAQLEPPTAAGMSDADGHQVNTPLRRQRLGVVSLFGFSPKFDPVAAMLVQNHRSVLPDFYGVTTSFMRQRLKPGVTVLAYEEGAPWAKYLHGDYGRGSWTYLGGHDPEDPQHAVGSAPTNLALHPNSPGYRLILNNVLFPAAKKRPRKT
ncbi:hypothetical protein BH23GEM2_BH23GEM2_07070 [soil metagenome]